MDCHYRRFNPSFKLNLIGAHMDFLLILICYAVGLFTMAFWNLINRGQKEGNRQDYITKIGLLKRETAALVQQLQHTKRLLDTANEDCHRLQRKYMQSEANQQILQEQNNSLRRDLLEVRSGFSMLTKM